MPEPETPGLEEPQTKNFNLRGISPNLHHMWKVVAAMHNVSMEKMAKVAIRDYCKSQLEGLHDVLSLDSASGDGGGGGAEEAGQNDND